MAAGAVPLVYGAAGPAEIVSTESTVYHWHDLGELSSLTRHLVDHPTDRERMAAAGCLRVRDYSAERFASEVAALLR